MPNGAVRFREAVQLDRPHWLELQRVVQRRVLRHFRRHALLIQGDDRAGIERLLRYCARPPFALERIHAMRGAPSLASPEARLLYRFPRPTPDGRTDILLSPHRSPPACSPATRSLPCLSAPTCG